MSEPTWTDADTPPERDGDYKCRVKNNEREFIAIRRFKQGVNRGYWFGGCRPFSDEDVVLAWSVIEEK